MNGSKGCMNRSKEDRKGEMKDRGVEWEEPKIVVRC